MCNIIRVQCIIGVRVRFCELIRKAGGNRKHICADFCGFFIFPRSPIQHFYGRIAFFLAQNRKCLRAACAANSVFVNAVVINLVFFIDDLRYFFVADFAHPRISRRFVCIKGNRKRAHFVWGGAIKRRARGKQQADTAEDEEKNCGFHTCKPRFFLVEKKIPLANEERGNGEV